MIEQDEITVTNSGTGYVIGEFIKEQHPDLRYIKESELVCFFDGLDNMLNFMNKEMDTPKRDGASSREGRGSFNVFETYEETVDVFRNKPQTIVKFDPAEMRISEESESGNRVDYDVTGDYIDMGRFMEGIPEAIGTMHNGNARNRRMNFYLNLTESAGMDKEDVIHRGERVLRLIDGLEANGVRCQITVLDSDECAHMEVLIKRHEEPLSITDLAVVSHSEFLRRIGFRVWEYSRTWRFGYGSSIALSEALESKPELLHGSLNDEINIFIDSNIRGSNINGLFDKLEQLMTWELSKPVPEVDAIRLTNRGISFNPNGMRASAEIKQEGMEIING